ncbi:hypothetical protein [Pedobacter sp. SYSU D00535]|uniref:hypothetical protein n=1 Tax=Pedobacter sp. SYSU D00535 TaxID=2810308 RepID=UPI001A95A5C0|nr:hypothetical protein [Pedobacter sp. SYSU D00535]
MKTLLPYALLALAAITMSFKKREYKVAVTYMNGRSDTLVFITSTKNNVIASLEDTGYCLRYRVRGMSKEPLVLTCSVKSYEVSKRKISNEELLKSNLNLYSAFQYKKSTRSPQLISQGSKLK